MKRGSSVAAVAVAGGAGAAYLLLLVRWFGDPGVSGAGSLRATPVWPFVVLFLALGGASAVAHRGMLAAMRADIAVALRLSRREGVALAVLIVISFMVQLPTMLFPAALLHSDSSINGLMALHIAEGRVAPAFYYGQEFMGTLFSHVLGLVFAVTGPFVAGISMLVWVFYACFLVGTFFLVRQASHTLVAYAVTLWLAVPPSLLIITLAQTEYVQLFVLAAWAFVVVAARTAGSLRHDQWWVVAGILFGLAFWAHAMAAMVIGAALASIAMLLPARAAAAALWRLAVGFALGVAPGLVGWGAGIWRFAEWFLQGGGRGGDVTLVGAVNGMARVSLGNLLLGTEERTALPLMAAAVLFVVVVASSVWIVGWGLRFRRAATPRHATAPDGEWYRAAAAVPLGFFVLLQLGVLLTRRYAVTPTQYLVPLYLGVPAVVGIAAWGALRRWYRWASATTAVAMLLWACVPLPGSIAWLSTLPGHQESTNASISALRAAGVDACIGPYWDAYRLSYLTLEEIVCDSIDVRRVPGYRERVAQRRDRRPAVFVAAPKRREALEARAKNLDSRGVEWTLLRTPSFEALLPQRR